MKALGVIRKIDSLGRIVIPKEVRRTQEWEEGQAMELFMDGNKLVIQSYEGERQKTEAVAILEDLQAGSIDEDERKEIESVINYLKGGELACK